MSSPVAGAAQRLLNAEHNRRPCAPVRELLPDGDVATGYAVQELIVRNRTDNGHRVVGRKIGLTSPAVQQQLGVDQPDFGFLFDDMDVTGDEVVDVHRLLQPKIEAEIAFVLGRDLDLADPTAADARAAVAAVVPAFEIVDSRVAGWDITIVDTIADNASSGLYVLGTPREPLGDRDLRDVQMELRDDARTLLSSGSGAACLGDPIEALVWLARAAHRFGTPLRSGEVVLSGALGPMTPVTPGTTYIATLSGLGRVHVTFGAGDS